MSVYRDPANRRGRRLLVISAIVALLAGALIGFLVARATEDEPTLAEQVEQVQADLGPAISALELVPGHYRQGVHDGEVVEPAQYEGARSQTAAAADIVAEAEPDLVIIAPVQLEAATGELERLGALIEDRASIGEVGTASNAARQALAEAAGDESAQLSE
jgi:hypothetical protein